MRRPLLVFAPILVLLGGLFSSGCSCNSTNHNNDAGIDAPSDGHPDAPPTTETVCEVLTPLTTGTCEVTGAGTTMLLKGTVLAPGMIFKGGQVAIDATGQIACVGCNCATGGETIVSCPDGVISPGLINTHDHIEYTHSAPKVASTERYEDRQQWRNGGAAYEGHTKVTHAPALNPSNATGLAQLEWGELRFVMGGTTSVVGSSTAGPGLVRNLDDMAKEGPGVSRVKVDMDTFPLDDLSAGRRTGDCNYGKNPTTPGQVAQYMAYEPHTSEGIDDTAHNEFLCQTSTTYDTTASGTTAEGGKSHDLLLAKTAMIHSIGLMPADYQQMAAKNTALIWSPRSNISLYGDTARLPIAARAGVEIALGTDWLPSGSMNELRELKCADTVNTTYFNKFFSDEALWKMATKSAASVTAVDDVLGTLVMGHLADISIYNAHGKAPFRAIIDADPQDVVLVMRSGKSLYGDAALIDSLTTNCDPLPVCGVDKKVCLMAEINRTYTDLAAAVGSDYQLFACPSDGPPPNEPTCVASRISAPADPVAYTGVPSAGDADGDGIPDATDLCPNMFDPIRPMDHGKQADADGDGIGDICDPCPTDANSTTCAMADPNDTDGDGKINSEDNCPNVANPDQADADGDGKGDACDSCPTANPGSTPCTTTIYAIKKGQITAGTIVTVENALVTGKNASGFFMQIKAGDTGYVDEKYSGIFVYTGTANTQLANAVVNRRVTVAGTVTPFGTTMPEIELTAITAITATTTVDDVPAVMPIATTYAEIKTGQTRAAELEGVLVSAGMTTATAVNSMLGEVTCQDAGANQIVIDDLLYAQPNPQVGQVYGGVTGLLALRSNASTLEPRNSGDLNLGPPVIASFGPALSYARVGETIAGSSFPGVLTVTLSGPAQGATTVTVTTTGVGAAGLTVVDVLIPDTMTSGAVKMTANTQTADVTVQAVLASQPTLISTAHVRVLDTLETPTTATLSPTAASVAPNGATDLTVTLDEPAPAGGTVVTLAATAGGSVPPSVTVLQHALTATFTYLDVAATAPVTVSAKIGAGAATTATVTVSTGANHLVINEVDYDNVGPDTAEYIEIFNPSGGALPLTGVTLYLVNGNGNTVYGTIDLGAAAATIDAGGYLVVSTGAIVPTTALHIDPDWHTSGGDVQNGPPDGLALVDTTTHTVIDRFCYEGAMTAVTLPGFTGPVSLVEGTFLAASVADSNTVQGALCRSPNGTDGDNAAMDWKFCTSLTPGDANP